MTKKNLKMDGRFLRLVELGGDLVLINLAFYFSFMVRYRWQPQSRNIEPFFEIIPILSIFALVVLYTNRINASDKKTYINLAYSVMFGSFAITVIAVAIAFFSRGFAFPRTVFILSYFMQLLFLF